jgi:hypothetical protein
MPYAPSGSNRKRGRDMILDKKKFAVVGTYDSNGPDKDG